MDALKKPRRRFSNERDSNYTRRFFKTKASKETAEKQVVNSLTELIHSKKVDSKSNIVLDVLEELILARLLDCHASVNTDKCYSTARKMAAFVADIMKEAHRRQGKSGSRSRKKESKSSLPRIPENRILGNTTNTWKKSTAAKTKVPETNESKRQNFKQTNPVVLHKSTLKKGSEVKTIPKSEVKTIPKSEREKLNSWLDDVSESTDKWTRWIKQTVKSAEKTDCRRRRFDSPARYESDAENMSSNEYPRWLDNQYSNSSFASSRSNDSISSSLWSSSLYESNNAFPKARPLSPLYYNQMMFKRSSRREHIE